MRGRVPIGRGSGATRIDDKFIVRQYFELERDLFRAKEEANAILGSEFEPGARTADEAAVDAYYALTDAATINDIFVTKELTRLREKYMASLRQPRREYVLRNINRRGGQIPAIILRLLPDSTKARIQASIRARDRERRRLGTPKPQRATLPGTQSGATSGSQSVQDLIRQRATTR